MLLTAAMLFGCDFNCYHQPNPSPNPGDPIPVDPIDPEEPVKFEQVSAILKSRCVSCHGGAGGYSFSTYEGVMDAVNPGNPDESQLCYQIRNGLMPPSGPQVPENEVDLICIWIEQGAKP
jgi:uncharacterized membrane protein